MQYKLAKVTKKVNSIQHKNLADWHSIGSTLKRDPIEENLDDFDDSSGEGGNRPATNGHFDAVKRS